MSNTSPEVETPNAEALLGDPTTSYWLKSALKSALERDPVDALNDSLQLADILDTRLRTEFGLDEPLADPDIDRDANKRG